MSINLNGWRRGLGAAITGLGMLSVSAASAVEVTVWCWDVNFNGATMKEAAARYTAAHPDVTFNIVDFGKADLEQKLQAQLASGVTEGLPDIVLIEDYGAQKYLQSFPGMFVPLSDGFDFSGFAPYKVAAATLDGKSYSMPFDSGVTGLFYRSDYFAEAGFEPADLEDITWEQLIDMGKAVKEKTGHALFGLDVGGDAGPVRIMMQSAGSWYFTPEGEPNIIGNEVLKAALETYTKLLQADIVEVVSGWSNYTGAFTSGNVAAAVTGVWMTGTIKANPDQSGKWAIAPLPKLSGVENATHASNLGGSSWYVFESAPNKDVAVDFLKTVWGTDVDFYQTILTGQGAVGSLLSAREGDVYKASDDFFGGAPVWQNFSTWLGQIPGVSYGIFTNEADAAVIAQMPALQAGGSVDDALVAIDTQLRQQMM